MFFVYLQTITWLMFLVINFGAGSNTTSNIMIRLFRQNVSRKVKRVDSKTISSDVIEKNKYLVPEDARLKKRQISPLLGVSETTVFRIIHEYLGMAKVSVGWITRILSPFQMCVRMETCEQFDVLCRQTKCNYQSIWAHHFDTVSK